VANRGKIPTDHIFGKEGPLYVWWMRDMALDLSSFYRGELAEVRRAPAAFLEVVNADWS
jgi:hypothetical protein